MAQQINLLSPILLLPKRYFSALAMGKALALVALGALALTAFLSYQATKARNADRILQDQIASERQQLQLGLASLPAAVDAKALQQQFDSGQQKMRDQRRMLTLLQSGLVQDGHRHSDLLQLLAATVPSEVWLTELRWQTGQLELDGATLNTSALRAWLDRLSEQPLLQGLRLSTIKIEKTAAAASPSALLNSWNFTLRSQAPAIGGTLGTLDTPSPPEPKP